MLLTPEISNITLNNNQLIVQLLMEIQDVMEEQFNGLLTMLSSTELNQLLPILIKLKMEHVIMMLHKLHSQLKHILILIQEIVMTLLQLSNQNQFQLLWMLDLYGSNFILEEFSVIVELLLTMLFYQQDMLIIVDLDIGLSKTLGDLVGDKRDLPGQLQEIHVLSAIKLVMETLNEKTINKIKY